MADKKLKCLENRVRKKRALRAELYEMLLDTRVPTLSAKADPRRVRLREQIDRLDEKISSDDMRILFWDRNKTTPSEAESQPREKTGERGGSSRRTALVGTKLQNPERYPVLSLAEVMTLFQKSRSTIYRWLEEGRLKRAGMARQPGKRSTVLILTKSVKKFLEEDKY